jgi:hypothetical protein
VWGTCLTWFSTRDLRPWLWDASVSRNKLPYAELTCASLNTLPYAELTCASLNTLSYAELTCVSRNTLPSAELTCASRGTLPYAELTCVCRNALPYAGLTCVRGAPTHDKVTARVKKQFYSILSKVSQQLCSTECYRSLSRSTREVRCLSSVRIGLSSSKTIFYSISATHSMYNSRIITQVLQLRHVSPKIFGHHQIVIFVFLFAVPPGKRHFQLN